MANRSVNDGFKWKEQREALQNFLNMCFSNVQLQSGWYSYRVTLGAAAVYCINGVMYSAAAVTSGYTVCAAQASGTACIYGVGLTSNQSLVVTKGAEDASGSVYFPTMPTSLCTVGYFLVSLAASVSAIIGSVILQSLWSGGNSVTFYNCAQIPQGVILSN